MNAYVIPITTTAIVLVGGTAQAVRGFRKAGSENQQILVDAAKDVVVIQRGVIEELTRGLADAKKRIDALQMLATENESLKRRVRSLEQENARLKARVKHLEEANGT